MNDKGSIVWRILFGVVMAGLLIGIVLAYTSTQREYATGKEAQTLASNLSETAFSAVNNQQQTFQLYEAVGNSNYELDVENNTFIVKILSGDQQGKEYRSTLGIELEVRDNLPDPGETLYLGGTGEKVILSSSEISLTKREISETEAFKSPEFYEFSKQNPKTATGLISAYFYARQHYTEENLDVTTYKWESSSILKAEIVQNQNYLTTLEVRGEENSDNVGYIDNVWTVNNIENSTEDIQNGKTCKSVENAYLTGWLYSPEKVESQLKNRTWRRYSDNEVVNIPQNIEGKASTVTTNVSTYSSWRFEFEANDNLYILHFGAMPWKIDENKPGFVFESKPKLVAG